LYSNFLRCFYEQLISNEFKLIRGFFDKAEINESSKYVGLCKHIGTMFYVVMAVNADICDYEEIESVYSEHLEKMYENIDVNNVIFVSVFITEKADIKLSNFSNIEYINYDDKVIKARWIAELSTKQLIINGNQINKIIDIEKFIKKAFNSDDLKDEQNIFDIIQKSREKDVKRIKSSDCNFTYTIAIINAIIFACTALKNANSQLIEFGGINSEAIFLHSEYYRLFTAMFIHIGIMHLLSNTLSLYIFATRVELYMGKVLFAIIYLVSGLGSSLLSALISSADYSVGASGAICGLMGAVVVYCIKTKKSIDGFNLYFIILFCFMSILSGFMFSNVDNAGHIGGFISGVIATNILWKGCDKNVNQRIKSGN